MVFIRKERQFTISMSEWKQTEVSVTSPRYICGITIKLIRKRLRVDGQSGWVWQCHQHLEIPNTVEASLEHAQPSSQNYHTRPFVNALSRVSAYSLAYVLIPPTRTHCHHRRRCLSVIPNPPPNHFPLAKGISQPKPRRSGGITTPSAFFP